MSVNINGTTGVSLVQDGVIVTADMATSDANFIRFHYIPNSNEPSLDQSKALRKNYAGIGYTYDAIKDAFIPLQPYPSWLLDEDTCNWVSPVAKPTDGLRYEWDESTLAWDTPTIK